MKKTVLVLAILYFGGQLAAQLRETLDSKRFLVGFNIGGNYSNIIAPGDNFSHTYNGAGFRLGLVASEEVNEKIILSPKVELSFNDGRIEYYQSTYKVCPINVDIMLHINHKLKRSKFSPYILAGPNFRVPIRNKEAGVYYKNQSNYGNNPDIAIDLGFGFEQMKKYFFLAPELRYSIGLLNINRDPTLKQVYFHNIAVVLNFKS